MEKPIGRISGRSVVVALIAAAVFLYLVRWILLPFVLAAVAAYICTPVVEALARRTRLPRGAIAGVVFAILVAAVVFVAIVGLPPLVREILDVASDLSGTVERLVRGAVDNSAVKILGWSVDPAQLAHTVSEDVRNWVGQAGTLVALTGWGVAGISGIFLTVVLLFYFLQDGPRLAQGLLWLAPPKQRPTVALVWRRLDPVLWRYFAGVVAVVVYAATAAYIGLGLVLGIQHAVALALLTGILEMLPLVGPIAAAVIAGLIAVRQATGFEAIIAYAIYATVLRLSIDQLFGPVILGRAARLHPTLIIFCFLAGGLLFGIIGVLLAIPVALAIKVTLATLYEEPLDAPAAPDTPSGYESKGSG